LSSSSSHASESLHKPLRVEERGQRDPKVTRGWGVSATKHKTACTLKHGGNEKNHSKAIPIFRKNGGCGRERRQPNAKGEGRILAENIAKVESIAEGGRLEPNERLKKEGAKGLHLTDYKEHVHKNRKTHY